MFWLIFFLLSFVGGQVLSVNFTNNIRISALDIFVVFINIWFLQKQIIKSSFLGSLKKYLQIFGVFILVCIISLVFQFGKLQLSEILISSLYIFRFIGYSTLVIIVSEIELFRKWSFIALWWAGTAISILGLIQYFLYPNLRNLSYLGWDPHEYRIFSTLLDSNFCGIIIVLTIFMGIYLIQNKLLNQKIGIGLLIINLISLFLTYSRGSYLAFLVGIGLWVFYDQGNKKLIRKIGEIGVIGVIFILILFLLPKTGGGEGVNLLRVMSIESRIENSADAWYLFLQNPIVGVGFDTLRYVRNIDNNLSHSGAGYHNSWLFILTTTGIFGLVSFLWIFWKIGKNKILIISLLVIFSHSMFDNSLFYPYVMFWMWTIVGYGE